MVKVRERTWVVSDIKANALDDVPQRLVSLVSVEDNAHGEELQVLWDLEPGAATLGQSTLPAVDGFDPPARLDAFLDAVRWGSIASADVRTLQSPFRSGITIEDYQLAPVNRALTMPRVNLLIADDVGLGKTIEAGLVALELILRHRARSILIVCPPSLQIQWRDQMQEKFGLEFRIVDRQLFRDLRRSRGIHVNPWTHFPRLITSIDLLKRDQPMRLMRDALPGNHEERYPRRFDLLIVDEAHNIAPSGGAAYSHASDRTRAIRELTPHFEHRLFLSATPHNGYSTSFWALLELLDDQRFARAVKPDQRQVDAVMIRRLKSDLETNWEGTPRFAPREILPIEVAYTDEERRAHRLLTEYGKLRRKAAADNKAAQISAEFVLKTLKKRLFSSPQAFSRTISQHLRSIETKNRIETRTPPLKDLRARLDSADEPTESDEEAWELTQDAFTLVEDVTPIDASARRILQELSDWADSAAAVADEKAERLLAWLDEHVRKNDERVIVFTEYRDTQNWLHDLFASAGLTRDGLTEQIYGGMDREKREEVKAAFQADPKVSKVRILLATDAASEGLDFQNFCNQIIHYEIPWNPNRLEQRNGRVDRHGQKADKVSIYHFVGAGYQDSDAAGRAPGDLEGDLEFLAKAARKVNQIREDLGSAGVVLAADVERAMLGDAATVRSLDSLRNDPRTTRTRQELRSQRMNRADIDDAMATLDSTMKSLNIDPARVLAAVQTALELAGQPLLQRTSVDGYEAWTVPAFGGNWAEVRRGLHHPFTHHERPVVFDEAIAQVIGDGVVYVHLNHPLVQRSLRLLQAALWGSRDIALHRATVRVVDDRLLDTPAVIAHGRLVITGGDGERLHEQLITAGGTVREGQFSRYTRVSDVAALVDAPTLDVPVSSALEEQLIGIWPRVQDRVNTALQARAKDRSTALENVVREREKNESAAIRNVLGELEATIRRELHQPEILQLDLFTDPDDKDQVERDRNALELRLERIPGELAQELSALTRRYERTEPRLFPVAVTWYVPRSIALRTRG